MIYNRGIKLILDQWTHTAQLDLKWAEPVTPLHNNMSNDRSKCFPHSFSAKKYRYILKMLTINEVTTYKTDDEQLQSLGYNKKQNVVSSNLPIIHLFSLFSIALVSYFIYNESGTEYYIELLKVLWIHQAHWLHIYLCK